jgi:hypothetical protein
MPITINIVLAGLIALVPNDPMHPTLTTAYVIKDDQHQRILRFYGDVKLDLNPPQGAPDCSVVAALKNGGQVIKCTIDDPGKYVEISIDAKSLASKPFLPGRPRREGPRPGVPDDLVSLDWLLHMGNVDPTIHGVNYSGLDQYVAARLDFEWDAARSCELDGSEEGSQVAELIEFGCPTCVTASFKQAVAESLLFRLDVEPGPVRVIIRNKGLGARVISAVCTRPDCLSIELDNSSNPTEDCDTKPPEYSEHFRRYYDLVNHGLAPDKLLLPFRKSGNNACTPYFPGPTNRLLLGCGLNTIMLADAESFPESVGERIVCPPVVLSP